jgi:pyruvate dehydrogenase phosphatase
MRRAAIQAFRLARRRPLLKHIRHRTSLPSSAVAASNSSNNALGTRSLSTRRATVLQSSMHVRSFSVALVAAAVASGAWYYKQGSGPAGGKNVSEPLTASASYSTASPVDPEQTSQSTRKALVVEQGQLYSGTIVGDGPVSKDTDDSGRKVLEMMSPEDVTQKLRKNEESYIVGRGRGVVRYDVVQIPSNDPIEDDHAEKIIEVPQTVAAAEDGQASSDWMFWGVFDGHSGWTTSAKLRQTLISFVARELNTTYMSALTNPKVTLPTAESIDSAIKTGFLKLDHEIIHASVDKVNQAKTKRVAAELLAPALSGSCALLSFYDSRSKLLRVACTGDSRAVLGRRGPSGKWVASPLSVDQTGGNPDEERRMRAEHPGEPNVIANGRVLGGLEPTRAFGDAFYKWTEEVQQKLKNSYFGRTPHRLLKTPPYVTAEPVVTTTKIEPQMGDFVVMATDGLWEMLTNEEVVGLVGQWLDTEVKEKGSVSGNSWLNSWFSSQSKNLPVEAEQAVEKGKKGGQRAPIRQQQWGVGGANERFVVADKNAATHLVRNALGGKDEDQLCALLTLPSPYSRRFR